MQKTLGGLSTHAMNNNIYFHVLHMDLHCTPLTCPNRGLLQIQGEYLGLKPDIDILNLQIDLSKFQT